MTSKTEGLTTIARPKPRPSSKGEPPKSAGDTTSGGHNTSTPPDGKLVDLGFKTSAEYRKNFRLFCADQDKAQVDIFKEAMADLMRKKGWPTVIE